MNSGVPETLGVTLSPAEWGLVVQADVLLQGETSLAWHSVGSELRNVPDSRFSKCLGIKRFLYGYKGSMEENKVRDKMWERSVASESRGCGPTRRKQWVTDVSPGSCAEERDWEMMSVRALKNMTPVARTRRGRSFWGFIL